MPDPPSGLEARLQEIENAIAALARRVAMLEDTRRDAAPTLPLPQLQPALAAARPHGLETLDVVSLLSLVGRTCVVLGGAYLLRALTETGRVPGSSGIALGLVYSVAWFGAADRTGLRRPISGLFHGVAGVLIGLPLLWEASMRFHLVFPAMSALALACLTALALAVAWHRDLQALAGVATVGAVGTALVLAVGTGALVPYALLLTGLLIGTWWLSDACGWPWLRWPAALAANLVVAALGARASMTPPVDAPAMALGAALLLIVATLGIVGAHAIGRGRTVRPFDEIQTVLALATGLAAAMALAPHVGPHAPAAIGAATIVMGAGAYGTAFLFLRFRPHAGHNFYHYSTLGLILLLTGIGSLLSGMPRDLTFTLLALGGAWLGARAVHPVFGAHSAVLAVAAATSSGLVDCSVRIWLTAPSAWPTLSLAAWIVLGAALPGGLIPRRAPTRRLEIAASMSRLLLALVLVASLGTLIVLIAGPWVAGTPPDPGRLASLKTVVLAVAAVVLALVARLPFGGELGWLAFPVLIAAGIKFVLEDFRVSTPSTLFIALAVYGTALILTARIRQGSPGPQSSQGPQNP